jgi:DNA-binding NtrC family response regulator
LDNSTLHDKSLDAPRSPSKRPGVLIVYSVEGPKLAAAALEKGSIVLGRAHPALLADERTSRQHVEIHCDAGGWRICDLGSLNGTFLDGAPVTGSMAAKEPRVVRLGRTLVLPVGDVSPYLDAPMQNEGETVVGPVLAKALATIDDAARTSDSLLVVGASGTGKELAARRFHARGPRAQAPLVAVNCATIPHGVAERLLFGAVKGAYSGATADAAGYVEQAAGGVLFLDEFGELEAEVQPKLLRLLDSHEVVPLGGRAGRRVDVAICMATNRDLAAAVSEGRFREDLYFRAIARQVELPTLAARREEIPFLVTRELERAGGPTQAHVKLIEACLLRTWPGNVRELVAEVRAAAARARLGGEDVVRAEHLTGAPSPAPAARGHKPTREDIVAALERHGGQVAAAARGLGLARTQLYRLMKQFGIDRPPKK